MLWIRKPWFEHEGAVDPARTVFFGHTTTTKLGDAAGEVAFSPHRLSDGRPAWVGMDVGAYNHVAPGLAAVEATSFRCVKQPTLRCDRWFERIDTRAKRKGKKRAWRGEENLREADVARSFGLKALAGRAKSASTSTLRAQRELEKAGVVFPQQPDTITNGGYRVYRKSLQEAPPVSRGPTSFRIYRQRKPPAWQHESKDRLRAV